MPFFHVAIAHVAVDQNVLERVEIFVCHVGAGDIRLGNDFHQRHAGAVEIHAAGAVKVRQLAHIFLEMRTGDADAGNAAVKLEVHEAVGGGRLVVLRELVIFRRVGVEIIFPVELRVARDRTVEQITGQHGEAQRLFVGDGQHTGQAEADGTDVGVRLRAKQVGATAPHFGFGFKLDVCFQSDDGFVFHCGAILATDETQMKHRFFRPERKRRRAQFSSGGSAAGNVRDKDIPPA